jgi:16S rRNA (adenine1518-N6/adenine1519-N6)-dimethyltransferase
MGYAHLFRWAMLISFDGLHPSLTYFFRWAVPIADLSRPFRAFYVADLSCSFRVLGKEKSSILSANSAQLKAKKSFGQHFLHREDLAKRIADSLSLAGSDYENVLEVGPGRGMLTKYLMLMPQNLKVVEADQDMVAYLQKYYPELSPNILYQDFLKLNLSQVFEGKPFGLVGNFPYNISSQIVFHMLEHKELVPEMVGMFQKEMAERIIAPPGSKTYGVISVLAQAFYTGKYLFNVDKSSFNPPPQVQSGVIRLLRKENQDLGCDPKLFRQIVKASFNQRRKMLRNTLKPFFKDPAVLEAPFFMQRPEQLPLEAFVELTQRAGEG